MSARKISPAFVKEMTKKSHKIHKITDGIFMKIAKKLKLDKLSIWNYESGAYSWEHIDSGFKYAIFAGVNKKKVLEKNHRKAIYVWIYLSDTQKMIDIMWYGVNQHFEKTVELADPKAIDKAADIFRELMQDITVEICKEREAGLHEAKCDSKILHS